MDFKQFKFILTTTSGNTLEWYDFALYGYFATVFSRLFFPANNEYIALMQTFAVFALGFVARPIGAVIFGHIGDKYGRKQSLIISICLITIATFLMGWLPTYYAIGIAAPTLMLLLRFAQGLAVSGELTGAGAFLVECAPKHKRGLFGSYVMASIYLGLLLGSAVGLLITLNYSNQEVEQFAWRIPFLFSALFGMAAITLRLKTKESPLFEHLVKDGKQQQLPVSLAFKENWQIMLLIALVSSALAVGIYLIIGYLPTYFITYRSLTFLETMIITMVNLAILTIIVPIMGNLSDKYGRKRLIAIGAVGLTIFAYPVFWLVSFGNISSMFVGELIIVLFFSPIAGSLMTFISELLPTNIRCSGISIGYNASMMLFGGTTPLIGFYLINYYGVDTAPFIYLVFTGLLTLIALYFINHDQQKEIT